eukprot:6743026-Karenia_brevis.AAC.1
MIHLAEGVSSHMTDVVSVIRVEYRMWTGGPNIMSNIHTSMMKKMTTTAIAMMDHEMTTVKTMTMSDG